MGRRIPTKPGFYWFRDNSTWPEVVEIAERDGELYFLTTEVVGSSPAPLRKIQEWADECEMEFSSRLESPWPEEGGEG